MDKKVYRKTRYQNIYQHIKNKNYVIEISKPVKTSISRINGEKIFKLEEAVKIRDNPKIKLQKQAEIKYKDGFDELWERYIYWCENVDKQAYNTITNKKKIYNKHLKNKIKKSISKIKRDDIVNIILNADSSDKQKNNILKALRTFFNWCIKEEIIIYNPTLNIKRIKVEKAEMKYWLPNQFQKFLNFINNEINNNSNKEQAYRTKMIVLLGFILGDRIGETRALKWADFNEEQLTLKINHSINYNMKDKNYTKTTKTYSSQREINITGKLIQELNDYYNFLENEMCYNLNSDSLIFYNYKSNKPFSDTNLRKQFYKYCELADVPKIRLYDLRHTYVAMMMAEGKELYLISERLGHINYSTTVNKYGHLSNQVRKEIAEITDKYI